MPKALKNISEFGFIEQVRHQFKSIGGDIALGIGDDAAAVVPPPPGTYSLLTTDTLIEGIHFNFDYATYEHVGRKAVAVNVSDIAAMGGASSAMLVSLGVPKETGTQDLKDLYRGISKSCKKMGIRLIGGNTARTTGPFFIAITLYGHVQKKRMVKRSGARPGDMLYITGYPGEATAGLEILKTGWDRKTFSRLVSRQLTPEPQWKTGFILGQTGIVSAMIDLSDGLIADLNHILTQSQVGVELEETALPVSPALKRYAKLVRKEVLEYMLYGGEDYELLFSVPPSKEKKLKLYHDRGEIQITRIGKILPQREKITLTTASGKSQSLDPRGFDHFLYS